MKKGRIKITGTAANNRRMTGADLQITIMLEDGTERLLPAQSLKMQCDGRRDNVIALVELDVAEIDVDGVEVIEVGVNDVEFDGPKLIDRSCRSSASRGYIVAPWPPADSPDPDYRWSEADKLWVEKDEVLQLRLVGKKR